MQEIKAKERWENSWESEKAIVITNLEAQAERCSAYSKEWLREKVKLQKCHVPYQLVALAGSRQPYQKRMFRFRYVLTWDGIGWGECCPSVWLIHSFSTRLRWSLDTRNMEDACKTLINKNKKLLPGVILFNTPLLPSGMSTLLTGIDWSMRCCWIFLRGWHLQWWDLVAGLNPLPFSPLPHQCWGQSRYLVGNFERCLALVDLRKNRCLGP